MGKLYGPEADFTTDERKNNWVRNLSRLDLIPPNAYDVLALASCLSNDAWKYDANLVDILKELILILETIGSSLLFRPSLAVSLVLLYPHVEF
ncbi:uncharacterized protein VTP21DRAFT_2299 [Calcarisporiella thermophila]|uniref:uncharacterized protein n=1 Tax=Calcarisporiella thermophila TaxID=911321 RepID=UPI00374432B3